MGFFILYLLIGVLFAWALGLVKDIGVFCNLVIAIIAWPFCIISIMFVVMTVFAACLVDAFKGGAK